jgi:hypothetical protein
MEVDGIMSGKINHLGEDSRNPAIRKKRLLVTGFILLLVLTPLIYFAHLRPSIVAASSHPHIYVKNKGRMHAVIHRVDAFWYWAGKIAFLSDMPPICQQVAPGRMPVKLQIPDLPGPEEKTEPRGPWYMKLAIRYRIPRIPIFRYTSFLYYQFDPKHRQWTPVESIPPKYRALGKVGMGNVGKIELGLK